jgi:hypothetical protein
MDSFGIQKPSRCYPRESLDQVDNRRNLEGSIHHRVLTSGDAMRIAIDSSATGKMPIGPGDRCVSVLSQSLLVTVSALHSV